MQLQHQTPNKPSPATTATEPADLTLALPAMSVPAVNVDHHLDDLRSRSQAMMTDGSEIHKSLDGFFKVAPYSFMTAHALMMRASVICACSHENVGFS